MRNLTVSFSPPTWLGTLVVTALLGLVVSEALAQMVPRYATVTISDQNNLIRGLAKVEEAASATVFVNLPPEGDCTAELIQSEGFSAPLKGTVIEPGKIVFARVPPGLWRFSAVPAECTLIRVEMEAFEKR